VCVPSLKSLRAVAVVAAALAVLASGCTGSAHASTVVPAAATQSPTSAWSQPSGTGSIATDPPARLSDGHNLTLLEGGHTGTRYDDSTLYVEAGEPGSLSLVASPGAITVGRRVRCTYHDVAGASNKLSWDITSPTSPTAGDLYVLRCVHPDDASNLDGYPMLVVFNPGDPLAGNAVGVEEIARFAVDSEVFESPAPVLSPPQQQVVGIDTWLAVSSQLAYPELSAQAGDAWVTVRPVLRDAVWGSWETASRCAAPPTSTNDGTRQHRGRTSRRGVHTFSSRPPAREVEPAGLRCRGRSSKSPTNIRTRGPLGELSLSPRRLCSTSPNCSQQFADRTPGVGTQS